jgi:hypothetical protein
MTVDPVLGWVVLFGGWGWCGYSYCDYNDTWVYSPSLGWFDLGPLMTREPSQRYWGMLTWDQPLGEGVLFGGFSEPSFQAHDDTWTIGCSISLHSLCAWTNVTSDAGEAGGPCFAAAVAENNTGFAPFFIGGYSSPEVPASGMWQFGPLVPSWSVNFSANPTTVNYTTELSVITNATGPHNTTWVFPDGAAPRTSAAPMPISMASSGDFSGHVTFTSALDQIARANFSLIVNPPPELVGPVNSTATAGVTARFNASVVPGTGFAPFRFDWSFGGGGTATGPVVNYSFVKSGLMVVNVSVTDSAGHVSHSTFFVDVLSPPSVHPAGLFGSLTFDVAVIAIIAATGAVVGAILVRRRRAGGAGASSELTENDLRRAAEIRDHAFTIVSEHGPLMLDAILKHWGSDSPSKPELVETLASLVAENRVEVRRGVGNTVEYARGAPTTGGVPRIDFDEASLERNHREDEGPSPPS